METKTEAKLVSEMENKIRRIELEFDQMLRKAESAEVGVRERVAAFKNDFEQKRDELKGRLDEARDASAAARDELTTGLDAAWNELGDSFNRARSELLEVM